MDCTGLTDFQVSTMMLIANIIAISLALLVFRFIENHIQAKHPGIDKSNARTVGSFKSLLASFVIYL